MQLGRLHRRQPGVFAWGRPDLGTEGELAVGAPSCRAGRGARIASPPSGGCTCSTAGRAASTSPRPAGSAPARESSCRRPGNLDRRLHRGLPVVPLPEALLAATGDLSRDSLRLVLARAEFERLLDRDELEGVLRSGRRGTAALRAAVDSHLPALARCANGRERDFVLLCERHRVPIPEPNERIGRYRPDMLWREAMLIVELDGHAAHHTAAQRAADERRQTELERLGYTVLRFTARQVRNEPERIVAALRPRLG